jgi:hypothetical protein
VSDYALTILQPWAWAIAEGHKTIENRPWRTHHRGTLYVHAGRRLKPAELESCRAGLLAAGFDCDPPELSTLVTGALVAVVDLVDCGRYLNDPWANPNPLMWHFKLANARALPEPVPMRGKLGIWRIK